MRIDKGKGIARDDDDDFDTSPSTLHAPPYTMEGGPVGPPPGFGPRPEPAPGFLLSPSIDYLKTAHQFFQEAVALAEQLLWGSHSLRLSVKTEYAAFLYECVHDAEGSRKLAKDTIAEVYEATEGIDNDMFNDACELVTVLGKMMKRGLGSNNALRGPDPGRIGAAWPRHAAADDGPGPPSREQHARVYLRVYHTTRDFGAIPRLTRAGHDQARQQKALSVYKPNARLGSEDRPQFLSVYAPCVYGAWCPHPGGLLFREHDR